MARRLMAWLSRLLPWVTILGLLSLVAAIWGGYGFYQAHRYNQHLRNQTLQNSISPDAIFADAYYQNQHKNVEKALKLYAEAASGHDANIRKLTHYNMANAYLRQANKLLEESGLDQWDKVTPLLSLAKEGYRDALRIDPDWMEAKYNYELALRLAPIIENRNGRKVEDEEEDVQETPPEGWPAIPGFPRGMP